MKKFAIAGLLAGVVLVVAGMVANPTNDSGVSRSPSEVAGVDAIAGLAPIDRVVDFFAQRAARSPSDYINRTRHGFALVTQAQEQADLELYENAETVFGQALELNPRYRSAQLGLAQALFAQHRFDEARAQAAQIVAETGDVAAELLAADAAFELGDYAEAVATYERLSGGEPTAAIVIRSARVASLRGDNELAQQLAEQARTLSMSLALRPNASAFYSFQVAHFAWLNGESDLALSALDGALTLDPLHAGAGELLAGVHAALGNLEDAAQGYAALVARGTAPDVHGAYADVLRALGRADEAAEQERLGAELAMRTVERFPAERRHLAGYYMRRDPVMALRLAETDFGERRDLGAYETLAWALHHNDRDEDALQLIDFAVGQGRRSAVLFYRAGVIALVTGNDDLALDHLQSALEINSNFAFEDADHARALVIALS